MADASVELLKGTLDVLVLKTLSWKPMHGFGIVRWIQQSTDEALRLEEGSLYPALHRLERRGFIKGEWGTSENNRRAKYYRLTAAGRRQLVLEADAWSRFASAMGKVLRPSEGSVP